MRPAILTFAASGAELAQRLAARLGGELCRIEVSVLDQIGTHRALRPRMAVTQWSVSKP